METPTGQYVLPPAAWTKAQPGINNGLPQAVAHRGYKANFPENTMGAFRGAVEVGAHAIETDVHLSKDGVVVIAHDKDLKRCYGVEGLVRDCDWDYLSTLKTLREPSQPMPKLLDVLEYLAEPGKESVWVFLDIKIDDAPEDMIPKIAETFAAVPNGQWKQRIVLGCWTAKHLRLCHEVLPEFAIANIGFAGPRAWEYIGVPNVAMNMRQETLFGFGGPRFVKHCQDEGRPLYAWTVNQQSWMEWCIETKIDCVVTDDPKRYLEVCVGHREKQVVPKNRTQAGLEKLRDLVLCVLYLLAQKILSRAMRETQRLGHPSEVREELRKT
ncbi:hypothetical protein VP1G_10371 [Cytospora mali]|uniref:GP-PDE domain-containing protein n=1 Tax=Cytospora mali TaxID=578113 RepID=A0A194VGU3_CYTMA|nr:hypothetical protein VP1G_10371 [Valsa mali var. pyri (nom. inval.)]